MHNMNLRAGSAAVSATLRLRRRRRRRRRRNPAPLLQCILQQHALLLREKQRVRRREQQGQPYATGSAAFPTRPTRPTATGSTIEALPGWRAALFLKRARLKLAGAWHAPSRRGACERSRHASKSNLLPHPHDHVLLCPVIHVGREHRRLPCADVWHAPRPRLRRVVALVELRVRDNPEGDATQRLQADPRVE